MKKQILNEEFIRMQKLAGIIVENKDDDMIYNDELDWKERDADEGQQVADFLNQHKEEVFEKMFNSNPDYIGTANGLTIDEMTDWEKYEDESYNEDESYICAQTDFPDSAVASQARFTPFPPGALDVNDKEEEMGIKTNIAGRTIYFHTFFY